MEMNDNDVADSHDIDGSDSDNGSRGEVFFVQFFIITSFHHFTVILF